jgi:hypothetical protein
MLGGGLPPLRETAKWKWNVRRASSSTQHTMQIISYYRYGVNKAARGIPLPQWSWISPMRCLLRKTTETALADDRISNALLSRVSFCFKMSNKNTSHRYKADMLHNTDTCTYTFLSVWFPTAPLLRRSAKRELPSLGAAAGPNHRGNEGEQKHYGLAVGMKVGAWVVVELTYRTHTR